MIKKRREKYMTLEVANKLTELRKNAGLSQEDVAAKLGVSRQAVSKWECGEASPDMDNLIALSQLYDVSVDEILCIKREDDDKKNRRRVKVDLPFIHVDINEDPSDEEKERVKVDMPFIHVDTTDDDDSVEVEYDCDEEGDRHTVHIRHKSRWLSFPYPVLVVAAYLFLGFQYHWWHPGWVLFLSIPLYYWLVSCIVNKSLKSFPVAVVITLVYLYLGFFHQLWHPYWILFILIPVFDFLLKPRRKK